GQPDDGFPAERYFLDLDGDGYGDPATGVLACTPPEPGRITQGGDCDDGDPAVHRDVDELCNGVDDDCDGAIDEPSAIDAAIHYLDADGDGTGDPLTRTRSCVIPFGHVSNGDDCDDASADRSPLLDERCDHVDNDCDQVVDEHPIDPTWTWLDDDRDGFGVDGTGAWMCFPGPDRALEGGDCDDRRAAVNPAAVEVCNGRDDDCDGDADSDAVDRAQVWRDDDGDGWGDRAQSRLACLPAPGWATQADDCDDHVASTHPGASEVCNHVDDDCDARVDESPVDAVIGYLDRDHDGFGTGARAAHCPYESADDDDDCDDSEARIHPGASEVCVGVDGDCDGVIGCGGDGVCTPQEEASGQLCEDCPPMKEVGQAVPGTCPGSATFAVDCQICGDSPTTCSGTVEAVPGVTTTIATLAPGECHTLRGVATGRTSCVIWDPNGAHTLELTYCYEVPCPEDDPSCRELDRCDADPTWTYNCTP
ncbi:MAG TPA: putative metal-binding motif-containing protein, partial [Myxococcota bacterium]|nr:putative metal-binding motif-containing protein [Myxococcota bacterium]